MLLGLKHPEKPNSFPLRRDDTGGSDGFIPVIWSRSRACRGVPRGSNIMSAAVPLSAYRDREQGSVSSDAQPELAHTRLGILILSGGDT
jgi:hypothetical protein